MEPPEARADRGRGRRRLGRPAWIDSRARRNSGGHQPGPIVVCSAVQHGGDRGSPVDPLEAGSLDCEVDLGRAVRNPFDVTVVSRPRGDPERQAPKLVPPHRLYGVTRRDAPARLRGRLRVRSDVRHAVHGSCVEAWSHG